MSGSFGGFLLTVLLTAASVLVLLALLLSRGWHRRLRRLRRRLLGQAWKPVYIEPCVLPEAPRASPERPK